MEESQIPQHVRDKIAWVVSLLNEMGIEQEQVLANEPGDHYDFLFPNSPYYRFYTHYLYQHGPTSHPTDQVPTVEQEVFYEGTVENIQIGAMADIIKQQLQQGHQPYSTFGRDIYQHRIVVDPEDRRLMTKIGGLAAKYEPLLIGKKSKKEEKDKRQDIRNENRGRGEEWRKESGANSDGSLGAYGGKKYEGLGMRDEFSLFRREKSQSYYSNLQDKMKQN